MLRQSLRSLALAAIAAFALGPAPAAAVTPVSTCASLTTAGETYVVTANFNISGGTCFRVLADRITLDLAGHTITGAGTSAASVAVSDVGIARTSTVVKNGSITSFTIGILLPENTRATVRAVIVSDNSSVGIVIGPNSLVKDCTVQRNQSTGIIAGDSSQVEGCVIGGTQAGDGNVGLGIFGGNRVLVTRNTVIGNGGGIIVGANSTVTHNTVNENGVDGINAGPRSLVTSNTANDNTGDGIQAECPATITHNTALGNGGLPINPPTSVNGCVILHNTTSPNNPT